MEIEAHGQYSHGDSGDSAGPFGSIMREYAVYTLSPEGDVVSWNVGAEEITGYSAAEVVGRNISMFYTPEQVADGRPAKLLREAAESGTCTDEGWRVRKDGNRFWAHMVTTALRAADGTLRGYARVTRDDTERHTELERSLRQFQDLFGLTPVAIGLFDGYGAVLDANSAMCELFGYRPADVVGIHAVDLVHPDDPARPEVAGAFRSGRAPEPRDVQEWSMIRADGEPLQCELRVTRSTRADGRPFWLVVFQDVTERHRVAEQWRYWATHDDITGLPNRVAVTDRFASADLDGAVVLYCDVDNFKRINESLGHEAGDELLVAVGRRLRAELPDDWLVGHPGGDEYVIVCDDAVAAGGVRAVAERVSRLLSTVVPLRGQLVHITASIGVSVGDSSSTVTDLMRFAGAAVLTAKASGRGGISVAGPELITSIDRKLRLEGELRQAIDQGSLSLAYQPIVAGDGMIIAAEALVRWHHPERGWLGPGVFLPVAEEGGLMSALDRWVLRTALGDAARWPRSPTGEPVAVSVNLGALSPADPDFAGVVEEMIAGAGIDWCRVIVELVETSLIDASPQAISAMRELTARGVQFSVDDFGVGYSSLARLKGLPVQAVKVDRSLVAGVATSEWELAVVKAVADLAGAMGCRCTAEGVETSAQADALRDIRVNAYQGWLFSGAVPSSDLVALIESGPLRPSD